MAEKYLNQINPGEKFLCLKVPEAIRPELIRLGLYEGNVFTCLTKIPAGPIVLKKDLTEIAIGRKYCQQIKIENEL